MNHGAEPVSFTLSLAFASDFADIFEVRGIKRERRGQAWTEVLPPSGVRLSYRGLDATVRETTLHFEPAPSLIRRKRCHLRGDPGAAGEARRLRHRRQPRPTAAIRPSRFSAASLG